MDIAKTYPGKIKRIVCIAPNIPNVGEWSCTGAVSWIKTQGGDGKIITFDPGSLDATSIVLEGDGLQA